MLFTVAIFTGATILAAAFTVAAQEATVIFIPPQSFTEGNVEVNVPEPGATSTCTGRPFTLNISQPEEGTCQVPETSGPPAGLVCDIPTTLILEGLEGETTHVYLEAFECNTPQTSGSGSGAGGGGEGGGATPISQ
jgi:hypothetical protein